ncbi:MAG: SIS domain-containing protein [Clostridia bacterium]|nr:SIS domain-containing protein [Clostridia bacterium]
MLEKLLQAYPALSACREQIEAAENLMIKTYEKGGKLLLCGNGGSAADCEHMVGELMKGFKSKRRVEDPRIPEELRRKLQGALPAISLTAQTSISTAFANDVDPAMTFAQLLYGYAREGDLLVGFSTSGNSQNIVNATLVAKALGLSVISMTGEAESKLSALSDVTIKVPACETYRVQEYHLPVYHYLCAAVESHFFGE